MLSLIGSYKLPDNDAVRIDLYLSNAGSQTVSFFQMDQNGNYSDTPKDSANMNNLENFSFSEKYTGFQLDTYRYRDGNSWSQWRTAVEDAKPQVGRWDDVDELQIRYKRVQKPITFMDGKYLKSDGTAADETNRGELKQTAPMYYGADTTSYNKGNSNYYAPEFEGYAFMGWYADETCTKPYSFDTMDADGITVYALWKGVKYHIVLHPNGSEEDPVSFADPTQALEFNVDNGEAIGAVGAERLNYDLVGWYTDESFKHAFDFDSFKVNGTIVKKYGTIYDNPDPANLIGELNLYANWRSKLEGDKGIDIVYTEGKYGDATKLPVDNESYTDKAQASAGPAIDSTDEDWVFSHWVVQKYEDGAFADTSVTVYPGDTFDVHVEDAKVEGEGEDTTYTIQLRAEFVKAGKATPTHIDFYYNYEGKDDPYVTLPNIEINSDVELPNPPGREGYNFVGWIKDEEGNPPKTTTDKTTLLITYDGSAYDHNVIAADELDPYEALYASWECKPYTVSYEYGNTAPGAPDLPKTVNYNAGESVTVAAEPTLEGYTFSGWSIKSPSGVVISGGKFNMPESNVVLTGTWTKNTHNVTYEFTGSVTPEGVQPPTDSTDYSAGAEVTVKDAPTAVGYTFSGWVAPEGVTITDGKFTMPDKDVTLTGSWSINKHKVTYVYDGDVPSSVTPPAEKTDVEYGSTVDAAPTPEAVAGYTFKGWDKPDSFSMPDKDVTITGTWEETPKVKVTFTAKSATKTYDGTPLTESGVTVKGLPSGYTYEAKTIGTITNSGTAPNTVESFVIYDADGKDVTTTFDVTLNDGTLKVNKRNVTITSGDATKVYDGTALTNSKIDISGDGFVEGQEPMITVTGSQTEVGSSKNTFTWSFANVSGASANAVLNALASNDVAANYVIHPVYGTLTVTAAPTPTPTPTPTPNNPGGGTAAAAAPAAAPQVIADEPTPTTIVDEPAPKAAPAYWALINLLCAIATALLSLIMLIRYFGKRKDEEELADPATGEMVTRDVEEQRGGLARIASLIPAIGGIIAFILTEDMSLPMAMVDKWTVLMIVILAIQAGVGIVAKLRDDKGDEDEEAMA
ncbi:MAG: InlB B-repeat-containing protein [Firmicutes bacterium]|nr:InlB B-repeat-containing protein [Bacillota bacterium]